ncbi:ABC transporter permease [Euzebya tangerina]|uniref:ABC transporter permease n=1 Tax=Euzebya tangerina TaxID=591198 RepID=UPI00196B6A11|nr:ABC transporter permease [Euzebya tangerina]
MSTAIDIEPGSADAKAAAGLARRRRLPRILGIMGAGMVATLLIIAIFAPLLAPFDPTERVATPFLPPSSTHPLGTNDVGNDLLSELIFGTRVSLLVGLVAATFAMLIGGTVGILAGYYPKRLGSFLMRGVDVVLILPFLPLLIVLAAYLGRSIVTTTFVIGILIWAPTARVIRSQVLSLRTRDYVLAAKSMGARDRWAIRRHVLPRTALLGTGEFVQATAQAILLEAALSFLGLGDPIQKSWGSILFWAQERGAFFTPAWKWWVLPPGLMIMASSLGFALMAFWMEERINPRL